MEYFKHDWNEIVQIVEDAQSLNGQNALNKSVIKIADDELIRIYQEQNNDAS